MTGDERWAKFLALVRDASAQYPEWREGQAFFNVAADMDRPGIDQLRGTDWDPFYRDERIPAFTAYLRRRWHVSNEAPNE